MNYHPYHSIDNTFPIDLPIIPIQSSLPPSSSSLPSSSSSSSFCHDVHFSNLAKAATEMNTNNNNMISTFSHTTPYINHRSMDHIESHFPGYEFLLLTGFSSMELIGRSFADFLHHDDPNRYYFSPSSTLYFYNKNGTILCLKCKHHSTNEYLFVPCDKSIFESSSLLLLPSSGVHDGNTTPTADFGSSTLCCMNTMATHLFPPVTSNITNIYRGRKDILLQNYSCERCGTRVSPEWRRGPHGPKTLCNACGLRWAKKNKKK
ncbi:uncharacterized protein BX664DRAFT_330168 [Halteromyces radiatus]|uniref:uncharacterized protein n=1 Tax=Halteromyces radiatus TaxID=101107 RepID=UPI00221E38A9|nr:uncharacterized protein BX664DRAFT_330168 [Halteromyces radiatus]KAI8093624.1 hypothetical protein BX664DRAFT_330168 [Halteromyces radiatus]